MQGFFDVYRESQFFFPFFRWMWSFAPIWIPLLLIFIWFEIWMSYKQRLYIKGQGSALLEIRIPRDIVKSPMAMELFLNTLYQASAGHLLKVYIEGAVRPWFSLELVSIDGTPHFFIWTHTKFKKLVETQIYAHFPEVEVHEVPDYAMGIKHDPSRLTFGSFQQWKLDKADTYPLKTYVEYGLDKNDKEEYKHDPIVAVLEFLGSLRKGEQAWVQIMIQAHTKEGLKLGRIIPKPDWKKDVEAEVKKIKEKYTYKPGEPATLMSKVDQETIAALERSVAKFAFDTMIRTVYFADKDIFNPNNNGGFAAAFRQFSSNTLNSLKTDFGAGFDYPWQDFRSAEKWKNEHKLLMAYKRRSFFNTPFKNFKGKSFILTTEELATLFHFPSATVAATPSLSRIPSKKAEAPANLPI